jgi:hypothetical protein
MTWRAEEHHAYWVVTDGEHALTMPDERAAHEVAGFYNRLIAMGYDVVWTRRLLTASWVDA